MARPTNLRAGDVLHNDEGYPYRIEKKIGEGGFGQTYLGYRLSKTGKSEVRRVCIKVIRSQDDWHGEALFGRLVAGRDGAVELLDAFVATSAAMGTRRHVLVFEYMDESNVIDAQ